MELLLSIGPIWVCGQAGYFSFFCTVEYCPGYVVLSKALLIARITVAALTMYLH
jgi:hypothetical protein